MSAAQESTTAVPAAGSPDESRVSDGTDVVDLPAGWRYRQRRIFGFNIPWYASPKTQLGMVAFVCFLCPGMFNALGGMGGGGKTDATLADNMNTALYSAFAVFGFFGGTFINKLGVKWTLAFGGVGYCIYAISLLASVHADVGGFNIFAGVLLGICAGLLWTAQGTIMISYPNEAQKGRYFAWFWGIFNMGAVIGSLIPLGENINVKSNSTVTDGTYIGFIILMFLGAVLALFLCNAGDIVRPDGTRVILMKQPSWQSELLGLWETLRFEPFVVLLFPMFFSSNWFYTYQQNAVNSARFDTRTKALNSLLYFLAQIIAAAIWGYLLDVDNLRRSVRAKITWVTLVVLTFAIWGGGYAYEEGYTRESVDPKLNPDFVSMDWTTDGYVGPMFLYIFYGFYDAAWQASVYWFMGALSNSGRRSANYVGFYKGIQSAGAAVMASLDSRKLSFKAEFISNWVLLSVSLVIAAPVIFLKIRDNVDVEDDLKGTDETIADVLPAGHPEKAVA
ncbi:UNC93-like protein [Tolypocladium capitatum]|uniref:UNC93-like protein n=1 Tax=Tolypocladium capitatum TaxID=45235 RepID=A0A2K3Q4S3_9HYPO|nr:UNC93-like protein [Tolypocladium capitatum]